MLEPRNAWLLSACRRPQALGVNARRGCQDIVNQAGWRLYLRETFQPLTACFRFGEQRPASLAGAGVRLETVESRPAEDTIKRVRKEQVELVALHSVIGVVWHHITCL